MKNKYIILYILLNSINNQLLEDIKLLLLLLMGLKSLAFPTPWMAWGDEILEKEPEKM